MKPLNDHVKIHSNDHYCKQHFLQHLCIPQGPVFQPTLQNIREASVVSHKAIITLHEKRGCRHLYQPP